jgi:hypothetical protein
MTECERMRDRMPDVIHGVDAWSAEDHAHLAACDDCALEWRLVRAGARLGGGAIAVDRIADRVTARLRTEAAADASVRTLPWRGGLIGLLALAASIMVVLALPRRDAVSAGSSDGLVVLPELQALDERQLESVLQSLGPAASDATPGSVAHLEDLTDGELEQLLHSEGGE